MIVNVLKSSKNNIFFSHNASFIEFIVINCRDSNWQSLSRCSFYFFEIKPIIRLIFNPEHAYSEKLHYVAYTQISFFRIAKYIN